MEGTIIFNIEQGYINGTLFDSSGSEIKTIGRELNLYVDEDCIEEDPEEWYRSIAEITGQMQESFSDICIDTISVTYKPGIFVYIDRSGSHTMNALVKCGCRMRYQEEMYEKNYRYQDESCRIPWKIMLHPGMMWINYNKPDVYRKTFKILTPDGYIAYRLCGETGIDAISALLMGYNSRTSKYHVRFSDDMKPDLNLFPDVKKSGECIGYVSGEIKEKLGLKTDARFIISSNNIECLSNLCSNDLKLIYDANTSSLCFTGDFFKIKKGSELIRLPDILSERYVYAFAGDDNTMFLKSAQRFMETEREDTKYTGNGHSSIMVYPYLTGRTNCYGSEIMGTVIGMSSDTSMSDIVRGCYECMGYELKEKIAEVLDYGVNFDSIAVANGIADETFYQILSDIISRKVYRIDLQSPANAGAYNIISGKKTEIKVKSVYSPDIKAEARYKELYKMYRFTLSSLRDIYKYSKKIAKRII